MANIFQSVRQTSPKTSIQDLSHDYKTSLNQGFLVPVMCVPTLPGDKFRIKGETLLKFQPLVAPPMQRFDVRLEYFYITNNAIWPGWNDWIKGEANAPAFPFITINGTSAATYPLLDYLGVPKSSTSGTALSMSAFPLAVYQAIYHEYYRDQNLVPEFDWKLTNGQQQSRPDIADLMALRRRAWEHDYFTSALPFPQAGGAVDVPLGDVRLKPGWETDIQTAPYPAFKNYQTQTGGAFQVEQQVSSGDPYITDPTNISTIHAYDPEGTLETTPITLNDLRTAQKTQSYLEKLARAGRRTKEWLKAVWDVNAKDMRLQIPEYIVGVKAPVIISEVLNTSDTANAPQGQQSGHAQAVAGGNTGTYYCEDHGWIMCVLSVVPKASYMQGMPKHFLKVDDFYQYAIPDFANTGEQEILNDELYAFTPTGKATFGYIPRYSEYRFEPNRVTGDMATSLKHWHSAREFANQPQLNQAFIEADPTDRIFAVTDPAAHKLMCQVYHDIRVIRKLPKYGTPTTY